MNPSSSRYNVMTQYHAISSDGRTKTFVNGQIRLVNSVSVPWPGGQMTNGQDSNPTDLWHITSSQVHTRHSDGAAPNNTDRLLNMSPYFCHPATKMKLCIFT